MSDRYQRVPIYQDHQSRRPFDIGGHSRGGHSSVFDDMRRQMGDWGADPLTHTRTYRVRPFGMGMDEDFDSLCKDFFELKPRNPLLSNVRGDSGSRESLDEDKVIQADSQGGSRKFQVSFDVKDYEPQDISVKVDKDTLVVEAKRETEKDGVKSSKQFSRNVHLPDDVDPDKLMSSLSNDGVLTLEAPIPPHYKSIGHGPPKPSASQPVYSSYAAPQAEPSYVTSSVQSSQYPHSATSPYQSPASYTSYHEQPQTCTTTSSGDSGGFSMPPPPAYPGPNNDPPPQPNYPAPPPPLPKTNSSSNNTQLPEPAAATADPELPLETPTFSDTPQGRRLDLVVDLGKPYTSDDIVVKLEGRQLQVDAEHVVKSGARKSKSCLSREFDLDEDIDPRTVQANFDDNGRLIIAAMVSAKTEGSAAENGS